MTDLGLLLVVVSTAFSAPFLIASFRAYKTTMSNPIHDLLAGERVQAHAWATARLNSGLSCGGAAYLTPSRLLFIPWRLKVPLLGSLFSPIREPVVVQLDSELQVSLFRPLLYYRMYLLLRLERQGTKIEMLIQKGFGPYPWSFKTKHWHRMIEAIVAATSRAGE